MATISQPLRLYKISFATLLILCLNPFITRGIVLDQQESATCEWKLVNPSYSTSVSMSEKVLASLPLMNVSYHLMAYDSESDVTLWFGGEFDIIGWLTWPEIFQYFYNKSWVGAYDYKANEWTLVMRNGSEPNGHIGGAGAMVYDVESDKCVAFGGIIEGEFQASGETWAFDYNSNTWIDLQPMISPPPRFFHRMAYDSESDRIVLFGGDRHFQPRYTDTWVYDLNSNNWTEMHPVNTPSGLSNYQMSYDSESDRVILFGENSSQGETWAYDYNTDSWTEMNPIPSPPSFRSPSMAYDIESDRVILLGSNYEEGTVPDSETWSYNYNNNTWRKLRPLVSPGARFQAAMVYNSISDAMILFGGWGRNDTWIFSCVNCEDFVPKSNKISLLLTPIFCIIVFVFFKNRRKRGKQRNT
jgi:hypothetical protein